MTASWLLVAGDVTPLGGMDAANHALARYLGTRGCDLHLVTHRAWPDVAGLPGVTLHRVWRPFNRHLLGSPILSREGRRIWRELGVRSDVAVHAIANGGNCQLAAANWVHYLHAAFVGQAAGPLAVRARSRLTERRDLGAERTALGSARVVICNSRRTQRDVVERLGIAPERTRVIYYGSDAARLSYVGEADRHAAKRALGRPLDRPLVGFVGALGDRRKAFDTVFAAWKTLSARSDWDADLVVVGVGRELPAWRRRVAEAGLGARVVFLGFRPDVPDVLAALDGLVHPARYEAYGLSVHEAICRGVPALVSAAAGVAERYPETLAELLIANPDDAGELIERLLGWRRSLERFRRLVQPASDALRGRTWDAMSGEIVACVTRAA